MEEQQAKREQEAQERSAALEKRLCENHENGTPLEGFSRGRWRSITIEALAANLVQFTEAPVVDQTGLKGNYSITIEIWKNPDVPGGTIFEAVEKLGLKLEAPKITADTVVVDRVSKMPTAN
ncbi:MAG: TIGR03435 family protein [Acidobacteria bacterium]|nr:TIGR03435 family protein [Acidobacteriota bacterium]